MEQRATVELDASVFVAPSFPFLQRLLTRMRFSAHMMSAHRNAITSLARSAVAATAKTNAKCRGSGRDRRIRSTCSGVSVNAMYVDFTPFSRQSLHGFDEQTSSNIPYW